MTDKIRTIAFYLPQFHPIPENDLWWGKGFTEWTNVGKAKKLFYGHEQPKVPADLGYYDLRVPETRRAQADMARAYGIEGFCYWHYWFGNGKRLLERPFNEVLASGEPDFPFCLAWANESWKGFEHGLVNRNMLIEQLYPGKEDYAAHFYEVLPAFKDKRYITVNGKPLFMIYKPFLFDEIVDFIRLWQQLAKENGLPGIHFVGHHWDVKEINKVLDMGFDAVSINRVANYEKAHRSFFNRMKREYNRCFRGVKKIFEYQKVVPYLSGIEDAENVVIPMLLPNWDHTPRSGKQGAVFHRSTPELFRIHVREVLNRLKNKPAEQKIVFLKSWNEWAEGNYVEPDLKWGLQYLEVILQEIKHQQGINKK